MLTLPMAPAASRLARQFVTSVTDAPEDVRIAVVVTELVTNAVVHGHSRPRLAVTVRGPSVLVEVADDRPELPVRTDAANAETSGRGLALVDGMADSWGARHDPETGGKVVWARIDRS